MSRDVPLELPTPAMLAQLARDDPEGLEALRRALVDDLIGNAPPHLQRRLRGLQFRIDAARQCSRSPLGSAIRVYRLMWESFVRLDANISDFRSGASRTAVREPPATARVIPFRPRVVAEAGGG